MLPCVKESNLFSVMSQCLLLSRFFRKEKVTSMSTNWTAVFQEVGLVTQWAVYHCYTCSHIFVSFWWRLSPVMSLIALCCLTVLLYLVDDWRMTQCRPFKSWLVPKKSCSVFHSCLSTAALHITSSDIWPLIYHPRDFMVTAVSG